MENKEINILNIYKEYMYSLCACVCLSVCMSHHNSGAPGAISSKLGTHTTCSM